MAFICAILRHLERGLPAEDSTLGIAGCSNGVTRLIQGGNIAAGGLGQGCRVIGSEGMMELSRGQEDGTARYRRTKVCILPKVHTLQRRIRHRPSRKRTVRGESMSWHDT